MISKNIDENKQAMKEIFNNTSDLVIHEFRILSEERSFIAYINGIVDREMLNEGLLTPLMNKLKSSEDVKSTIPISPTIEVQEMKDCISPIVNGDVALFIEGLSTIHIFSMEKWNNRQVEKPTTEMVIRGPNQAFIENIAINKTLIRRIIKNNNLIFEDYILGLQTNTTVSLAYIKDIVKPEVLEEVRNRIKDIEIGSMIESGYIEDYISDKPKTIISTISNSEKPDITTGKMLEGCIAILCDGTPHVLAVPKLFIENLHSPEDYYIQPRYATFLRIIRLISLIFSITLPGVYISMVLFHQEMIPTELLISIAGQREGVPLSSAFEAIAILIFFEILKESAVRLPQTIGPAITLVGGLVIGQAAVEAGVISGTMVIVIAATGLAEFVVPKLREMITIYRVVFLILGTISGLYGMTFGLIFLVNHLVSMKSFGVPFMWPLAPYDREGMKDAIIKYPVSQLKRRPPVIAKKDSLKRSGKINEDN